MAITVTNVQAIYPSGTTVSNGASYPTIGSSFNIVSGTYYVATIYGANMPTSLGSPPWYAGSSKTVLPLNLIDSIPGKMYVYGGFATSTTSNVYITMQGTQDTGSAVTYWCNTDAITGLSSSGTIVQSAKTTTAGTNPGVTLSSTTPGSVVYMVGGST